VYTENKRDGDNYWHTIDRKLRNFGVYIQNVAAYRIKEFRTWSISHWGELMTGCRVVRFKEISSVTTGINNQSRKSSSN